MSSSLWKLVIQSRSFYPTSFRSLATAALTKRECVSSEKVGSKKNIALLTLTRPKNLNALSPDLKKDLTEAIIEAEKDKEVGVLIITGQGKAFIAGADIKEMKEQSFMDVFQDNTTQPIFRAFTECRKPIIAAVNGYALGGGCEVAMMCDVIYASELAKFGQPEILLGIIPGAGGTQRLIKSVGKSKAMEMCLSGNQITAQEAEKIGLVSKVVAADELIPKSIELAEKIASQSKVAVAICKEAINKSFETTLHEGLNFERRLFHATFATEDRKEGMAAFVEKRPPNFQDK